MPGSGFIEIDVHGLSVDEAVAEIERTVAFADGATYRVRVIHGFNRGKEIKNAVMYEFGKGRNPKVKRVEPGSNQGITDLVLREY